MSMVKVLIKTLKYNNYYNLFTKLLWKSYECMYVQLHVCNVVHMHACMLMLQKHVCMYVCKKDLKQLTFRY